MKKDVLKEFVSENRDDFDDQEPGLDILDKIHSRLGLEKPVISSKKIKRIKLQYWWAAAASVIGIICIAVFFQPNREIQNAIVKKTKPASIMPCIASGSEDSIPTVVPISNAGQKKAFVKKQRRRAQEENITPKIASNEALTTSEIIVNDWQKTLQSESASARLAAVLASGKRNVKFSNSDLQTLFNTMNNDESSNVRLAALEVLKKQENQHGVKNLILQSVAKQDDPVVQMELLASLSSDEATKVKKALLDITQNPMNIDAVRNEAYAVLLLSNTNF